MKRRVLTIIMLVLCMVCVTTFTGCGDVDATGVALDRTSVTMIKGDTFQLTAKLQPSEVVDSEAVWTTSDSNVATVSETGVVTAVNVGSATITVTSQEKFNATCQIVVESVEAQYTVEGEYVYFGMYPQTLKASTVTLSDEPNADGYYVGSDNELYVPLFVTPFADNYTYADGTAIVEKSCDECKRGAKCDKVKEHCDFYKLEPIKWRVLTSDENTALLLCDTIIANVAYGDSNAYDTSTIRTWLNDTFLKGAFKEQQQAIVKATLVENGEASTGCENNSNACADTLDKVFLLSYAEVDSDTYGLKEYSARAMKVSDYARATGAWMSTSAGYEGNGLWWTRSPHNTGFDVARPISSGGYVDARKVTDSTLGVVPVLQIKLK